MPPKYSQNSRVVMLLSVVVATLLVWGVVLPSIAARPDFVAARQRFEDCGIDATAMFYSDHPRTFETGFAGQEGSGLLNPSMSTSARAHVHPASTVASQKN